MAGHEARHGFSLVELLIALTVLSILAGLAMPNLQRAITKARAVDVVADLEVVRVAALNYHSDYHGYPRTFYGERIPADFRPYLPDGFQFVRDDLTLLWKHNPSPPAHWRGGFAHVQARFHDDQALATEVKQLLGPNAWLYGFGGGRIFYFVDSK